MEKAKKLNIIGVLLLLTATIFWGTSFFLLKETINEVPVFYVIAIRFMLSALGLFLIFFKKIIKMDKKTFFKGVILGLVLTAAYISQTLGLKYTTPGRNAFLTASYCILCPFIIWLFYKVKPKLYNIVAAVMCIVGIGLIALSGGDNSGGNNLVLGDGLTLFSAIFYALQIIFIDKFQKEGHDSVRLLVVEIFTVGVVFSILSLIFELPQGIAVYKLNWEQFGKIMYLTFVCTLYGQWAQTVGQKFTTANQSSIILSLESVFGVFFSVLFGAESLTVYLVIGFIIVFIAILISELKIDITKFRKKKPVEEQDNTSVEVVSAENEDTTANTSVTENLTAEDTSTNTDDSVKE